MNIVLSSTEASQEQIDDAIKTYNKAKKALRKARCALKTAKREHSQGKSRRKTIRIAKACRAPHGDWSWNPNGKRYG